jgi:hypothetical protein
MSQFFMFYIDLIFSGTQLQGYTPCSTASWSAKQNVCWCCWCPPGTTERDRRI